jgi:hypothetical protein
MVYALSTERKHSMNTIRQLVLLLSLSSLLLCDVVELKTGERLEGTFKQATSAGVIIEVGGQSINMPLVKVKAIYFGSAKATAVSPKGTSSAEVMDALKALRSITHSALAFQDYAPRVLDCKIKVDKYLSTSGNGTRELRTAIRLAMREYELASQAWDTSFPGHGDLSMWKATEANLDPDMLKTCSLVKQVVDRLQLTSSFHVLGMGDVTTVDGKPAHAILWQCAADQVAEAERLLK